MSITLGSNIASLQAQRQLFKTEQNLSSVFERLSSGQRINRASDDAAGLAISESLNTDRRVFNQGIRNLNDGLSVLNIADSAVAELSGIVTRIQELAEQAANGSLSLSQRGSLDAEAQALKDEFFRVSRSADFNGLRLFDGSLENGVRLQAGYGENGSIFSSLGGALGNGDLEQFETFASGMTPFGTAVGDFDNDGNLDVALGDAGSTALRVLYGDGSGSFGREEAFDAGFLGNLRTGDLDGDGALDVMAYDLFDDTVQVLLNDGSGSFSVANTLDGPGLSPFFNVGDFNNDGNLDLIDQNTLLLGQGDGSFTEVDSVTVSAAFSIADFNNDGLLDAAGDTTVHLGNGDGTFRLSTTSAGGYAGDLDGDGLEDLVRNGSVFLGNGDGTFSINTSYAGGNTLVDLNGDGHLDVIDVLNSIGGGELTVAFGRGDGTFGSETTFTTGGQAADAYLQVGDFNNDGIYDALTASDSSFGFSIHTGGEREGIAPILDFSLKTQADALQALAPLERKLQSLSEQRGTIGAFQSRLQSALNTLSATSENYAAAESRIKDADIAFESSQLTRLNILQQAASAVLGQANQQPALALQLLQ